MKALIVIMALCSLVACDQIKGAAGSNGLSGAQGEKGDTGPEGPDHLPFVFTNDNVKLGRYLAPGNNGPCIYMADDSLICIDEASGGKVEAPIGHQWIYGDFTNGCYYASTNCSGTCKYTKTNLIKNSIIPGASSALFKYVGTETDEGSFSYGSYMNPTSCTTASGSLSHAISLTTYTLPTGITFPVQTPLYLDIE